MKFNPPTFVKWAGGKAQLISEISKRLPKEVNHYAEPFLGGGAIFFFVRQKFNPQTFLLNDSTNELIQTFEAVRDTPEKLSELLEEHKKNHSKEYFYKIRSWDRTSKELTPLENAARMIYLNKTCFNGLYRVNSRGEFNVPIGSYTNPSIVHRGNITRASKFLEGSTLSCQDFREFVKRITPEFFVYLDPPYHPINGNSFTSYTSSDFKEQDQKDLCDIINKLDKRGVRIMLSNSDTEFIRELYNNFKIDVVSAKRFINSNPKGRGSINELIITNY